MYLLFIIIFKIFMRCTNVKQLCAMSCSNLLLSFCTRVTYQMKTFFWGVYCHYLETISPTSPLHLLVSPFFSSSTWVKSSTRVTTSSLLLGCCDLTQILISPGKMVRNCSNTKSSRICSFVWMSGLSH